MSPPPGSMKRVNMSSSGFSCVLASPVAHAPVDTGSHPAAEQPPAGRAAAAAAARPRALRDALVHRARARAAMVNDPSRSANGSDASLCRLSHRDAFVHTRVLSTFPLRRALAVPKLELLIRFLGGTL
eukprot:5583534-Pleurochrysis_carterae.AAC.2